MMVLNLLQVLENDQATQLQNENYCLSTGYLKGTRQHYKMKIHFIIRFFEGDTPPLQNEDPPLFFVINQANPSTTTK